MPPSRLPRLIQTERLKLLASSPGDGATINVAIAETFDQLHLWMPWAQALPTPQESEAYAQEAARKWQAGTQFNFKILLPDGAFVGHIGIWPLEESGAFEIGYWCRASMQKRGYTSESVRAIADAALKYLQPRRIVIRCDSRNVASQNVALRCGFELSQTRGGDATANDGSTRDTQIFTLETSAA